MTKMLASVNSLEEAQFILETSVDIIDLKQPKSGALGALSIATVKQIVQKVNQQKPVSATIGDLPMQADLIFDAVSAMSETGVDYIKIGLFPDGNWQETLTKLRLLTQQGHQLIAVLFADTQLDFHIIEVLKQNGFTGVMLDTMNKSSGTLPQLMSFGELHTFVKTANNAGLFCGLAGSLKSKHIPELLTLKPDYLGFRGALCEQHNRTATLHAESTQKVLSYF
ncbi:MAG: (5-formylfuran-3-yl)methyl phosphate synthase [Methylococcales bacterium]